MEIPTYSNGKLNYEDALDPVSVALAERLEAYYGPYNSGLIDEVRELDSRQAQDVFNSIAGSLAVHGKII
jgi:hypothetical protein